MRQNQKFMSSITCEGIISNGIEEVKSAVRNFYKKLYDAVTTDITEREELSFFKHCPKLSESQREAVDKSLSLNDLKVALKSCSETSPGPDGISYVVYKSFWEIISPFLLNSWNYSLETGSLPPSNLESVISLLPKQGKDTSDIKNWRPITLSNCDSKIITKAIAIKVLKVLESIVDKLTNSLCPWQKRHGQY